MPIADTAGRLPDPGLWACLDPAGDEAMLPAGTCLADPARLGRFCFRLLDGAAVVRHPSGTETRLGSGAFIGIADADGRPGPLSDVTVRLERDSRVIVFDAARLAAFLGANPDARTAWQCLTRG